MPENTDSALSLTKKYRLRAMQSPRAAIGAVAPMSSSWAPPRASRDLSGTPRDSAAPGTPRSSWEPRRDPAEGPLGTLGSPGNPWKPLRTTR